MRIILLSYLSYVHLVMLRMIYDTIKTTTNFRCWRIDILWPSTKGQRLCHPITATQSRGKPFKRHTGRYLCDNASFNMYSTEYICDGSVNPDNPSSTRR